MLDGSTLVVVADGKIARFLSRARPGSRLVELVDSQMTAGAGRQPRDRPPRVHDSRGPARHAIQPHSSPHDAAEQAFLHEVLDRIDRAIEADRKAELVLCAPPRALGMLRHDMPPAVRERLVLSIDKDVTKETPRELDERLKQLHF